MKCGQIICSQDQDVSLLNDSCDETSRDYWNSAVSIVV